MKKYVFLFVGQNILTLAKVFVSSFLFWSLVCVTCKMRTFFGMFLGGMVIIVTYETHRRGAH